MRIAILRALQLGDLLCAVPALRALHAEFPAARISLIGLPWAREFVQRFRRYLFDFVEFPGYPGLPERRFNAAALPGFFADMRRRRFELALQMHGSGQITNPLVYLLGARRAGGYGTEGFPEWREREPEVERWLRLVRHVGAEPQGAELEFPLGEADWDEWRAFNLRAGGYVVMHPGSQLPSRRWPAERFAQVADSLAADGLAIVLTGTRGEARLTARVAAAMRAPSLDLAGLTSTGGVAALIARARLLVSNDTGVSHIAAALRTPSVIVASGSDPARWAPQDKRLHRVLHHPIACRPCSHAVCPIGHPCALAITAEQVIEECMRTVACVA